MTDISAREQLRRADAMEAMSEAERNVAIALGVMQRNVIDARHRFDPDRLLPTLADMFGDSGALFVSRTVFEGAYRQDDEGPISA
jgi:hypothetical protein